MLRRGFLAAGLAGALFAGCGVDVAAYSAPKESSHPPLFWQYIVGDATAQCLVTLGEPRIAVQSSGPSDYAWFAGMRRFPNGNILMRWSYNNDGAGNGQVKSIISSDNGLTFPTSTIYTVTGKPSPQEPMVMESNGTLHGGEFWQWSWVDASRRKVSCGYQTITNGGATYSYTPNGVTITGLPQDIGESFGAGFPALSWTDRIVKVSDVEWYSTVQPVMVGQVQVFSYAIKSTDQGHNWVVVGQQNSAIVVGQEGYSEVSTILDGSRLISLARTGQAPMARCYSDDWGVTWVPVGGVGTVDQGISAWYKSPYFDKLGNGAYALLTGPPRQELIDDGQARAHLGLYVVGNVLGNKWPVIDLWDHHNMMLDSSLHFDDILNVSTGYMAFQELSHTPTTSDILINYDQCGGSRGTGSTRPNRIFVVNAKFERVS